jgi:hypothetical protein
MQSPDSHPVSNRVVVQPEVKQLPAGDVAFLPRSHRGDRRIDRLGSNSDHGGFADRDGSVRNRRRNHSHEGRGDRSSRQRPGPGGGRVPAVDAAFRLVRAQPRGLVARHRNRARPPADERRDRRPCRHRPERPDARPGRAGHRQRSAPAGDPLERPAHASRVRGDRVHRRARAADRIDRQPRTRRLHRSQADLDAPPRARAVRPPRARGAPEGLRTAAAVPRACHRRLRRVRNAAARRRRAPVERRDAERAPARSGLAAAGAGEPNHLRGDGRVPLTRTPTRAARSWA